MAGRLAHASVCVHVCGPCVGRGQSALCAKFRVVVLKFRFETVLIGVQCFCDCDFIIGPNCVGFVSLESRHDFLHLRHWFC